MLLATSILGWMGILLFVILALSFQKLAKRQEFGFIHLILALMYTMWLPLPFSLYGVLYEPSLIIGTIFGYTYFFMKISTMVMQTGHLVYSAKQPDKEVWEGWDNWAMATFGGPYEVFANILRCSWAIFLAITFWKMGDVLLAVLMSLFSLFIIYFSIILLNLSLVKPIKLLTKVKSNPYIFNFETVLFFLVLVVYIGRHIT